MSGIRVVCRKCGAEVDSDSWTKDGRCTVCEYRDACLPHLERYRALWGKRMRYLRAGASVVPVENAIEKERVRMLRKIHVTVDGCTRALDEMLEGARQAAEHKSARIHLAGKGELVAPARPGEFLRAGRS